MEPPDAALQLQHEIDRLRWSLRSFPKPADARKGPGLTAWTTKERLKNELIALEIQRSAAMWGLRSTR